MAYYRIVNWDEHYEVDNHGKPWEPGQAFRKGPLQYIRVRARRDWNVRLLELHDRWGEQVWMVVGIFGKLCQIVGAEDRRQREGGIIRNCDGEPAADSDICRMLGLEPETWKAVAASLCDPQIHWLTEAGAEVGENPEKLRQTPEVLGKPHKAAEIPEKSTSPGIPGFPGNPLSSQVKSNQLKPNQVKTKGPIPLAQIVGQLLPPSHPPVRLDAGSREVLDSTRLGFLYEIRQTLGAEARVEARTVSNFEQWVHENVSSGRAGPDLRQNALNLARDCVRGRKPMAVFLARAKQELGYVAPSRRPTDTTPT